MKSSVVSKEKGRTKGRAINESLIKDISFREMQKGEKFENQGSPLENRFREAINKIFKLLDIFNRGKISETNINKWIPESALYFLGSIFQNIKLKRLSLSSDEFLDLCMPLLHSSNPDDL